MTEVIIALLVILVLAGVGYWAVTKLAAAFGLPAPVVTIAQVVIVVVAVLAVVQRMGWVS